VSSISLNTPVIGKTTPCRIKPTGGTNSSFRMDRRCWLFSATESLPMTSLMEVDAAKTDKEAPVVQLVSPRTKREIDKVCST
jgi:hypothetical protein